MKTVSIVGVGLIGGSFALALRKAGFTGKIIGVSSPATIEKALKTGVIDEGLPLAEAAAQSDLVYLSQLIRQILSTLAVLDTDALITDAGSTKVLICEQAQKLKRGRFVGGHPMAGKETRGVTEADATLFHGRPYILTEREPMLEGWIEKTGARLVFLKPAEHDRLLALVSHLEQLVSTALAESIMDEELAPKVAGPGLRDMTRLALSPYDMWKDIFETNAPAIDAAIAGFIAKLEDLRTKLRSPEMEKIFAKAESGSRKLRSEL